MKENDACQYSVLMSVYYKEKPEYLRASIESMFNQTVPTNDFVLVCDGHLNDELDAVIAEMQRKFDEAFHVVRLEKNSGLGNALNEGIKYCKNELIARMDSDDISKPERCEIQLSIFTENNSIDLCSGTIEEFETAPDSVLGKRKVPITNSEIIAFSKKRNPFNHVAMMFKKEAVVAAGGYKEIYHLFEDYYLWIRMLQNGSVGINTTETLVMVRTPSDMYLRRGGKTYMKDMLRFHRWLRHSGWSGYVDYYLGAIPHAIICILPNVLRKAVYQLIRRKK